MLERRWSLGRWGPSCGPADVPGKGLAGGLVSVPGKDLAGGFPSSGPHLVLYVLGLYKDPHATICTREIPSGAFSGDLPEGDSIMEGFYINTIACPMKRE